MCCDGNGNGEWADRKKDCSNGTLKNQRNKSLLTFFFRVRPRRIAHQADILLCIASYSHGKGAQFLYT
jgi:hypothetical protein